MSRSTTVTSTGAFSSSSPSVTTPVVGTTTITTFETPSPPVNAPPPPTTTSQSQSSSGGLSTNAIIGITVGVSAVLIALAIFIIWYIIRKDNKRHALFMERARNKAFANEKAKNYRTPADTTAQGFHYEPVPYPDKPPSPVRHSTEGTSSITQWLTRQPSKYSSLSDGEVDLQRSRSTVHTIEEEREPSFRNVPSSEFPNPWFASDYALPSTSSKQKPDLRVSTALASSRNGDAQSATSDSETASVYSDVSASTSRLPVRKQSEPTVSPIPEHQDEALLVAASVVSNDAAPRPTSTFSQKSKRRPTTSLYDDEEYEIALRHGLQLPPPEEPPAQLERGKTKLIANLLLSRANRNVDGLKRSSTIGSTVSHIEKEGEIMSPINEEVSILQYQRPRTSFDVDLPANSAMDRL